MVAIEHVVNQDDPFRRRIERNVAALARDHVEIAPDALGPERPGRFGRLRVNGPRRVQDECEHTPAQDWSSSHACSPAQRPVVLRPSEKAVARTGVTACESTRSRNPVRERAPRSKGLSQLPTTKSQLPSPNYQAPVPKPGPWELGVGDWSLTLFSLKMSI